MKKEAAENIRQKMRAIEPLFIEWERNPKKPRELYLIDDAKDIQTPVTDVVDEHKLEGSEWALNKKAITAPVAIQIIIEPKARKFPITSCNGFTIDPINRFLSTYRIITRLSLFTKNKMLESASVKQFSNDETELIYGISKRSARAVLWEAHNRLHIAHYLHRDSEKGEPCEIIKSKPIKKTLEAHNGSGSWRISAWMLWDQFNRRDVTCNERALVLTQMTGHKVSEEALRSAVKEVNLSLGES